MPEYRGLFTRSPIHISESSVFDRLPNCFFGEPGEPGDINLIINPSQEYHLWDIDV